MVALKLQNFGGMIPAVDPRLLPQTNAELSTNTWLYNGALEGLPEPVPVHTMVSPTAIKVFRIPFQKFGKDNIPDSYWLEFQTTDVDVVTSPTASDSFERYYWAGLGMAPQYNTKARIEVAATPFKLGIPAPTTAPGVIVSGGAAPTETRAYVYTWVSGFGEEGPPSPPQVVTGNANGTWDLTLSSPGAAATDRNLTDTRIYRTITGSSGSTTYYLVAEIAIGTTAYADTVPTVTVAGNNILQSTFWTEPPSDLQGMIAMPNGIIAGWRENEIWFCEPYRPHAWPVTYVVAVDSPVVGLGVMGQTLIVCTSVSPYAISGVNPATMSISRIATYEPCLSRGSIISTPNGVIYASQNGLILATPAGAANVSRNLISKDVWLDQENFLNVTNLKAAVLNNNNYYCWGAVGGDCFEPTAFELTAFLPTDFTGSYTGALLEVGDGRVGYTKLTSTLPTENCFTDQWTGEVLLIRNGQVLWLDMAPTRARSTYVWKSKVLETPNQRNFQAMRIYFNEPPFADEGTFAQGWWDDADQWDDTLIWNDGTSYGTVRLYSDGVFRWQRPLRRSGDLMRLPAGFKGTYWQIEVEASVEVYSIEMATGVKELGGV